MTNTIILWFYQFVVLNVGISILWENVYTWSSKSIIKRTGPNRFAIIYLYYLERIYMNAGIVESIL